MGGMVIFFSPFRSFFGVLSPAKHTCRNLEKVSVQAIRPFVSLVFVQLVFYLHGTECMQQPDGGARVCRRGLTVGGLLLPLVVEKENPPTMLQTSSSFLLIWDSMSLLLTIRLLLI